MSMKAPELKAALGLPQNTKSHAVYNYIIRWFFPGGNEILNILTRLHEAQHGRLRPDPMLQDLLNMAITAREKMVDAIQNSEDGILAWIPLDDMSEK